MLAEWEGCIGDDLSHFDCNIFSDSQVLQMQCFIVIKQLAFEPIKQGNQEWKVNFGKNLISGRYKTLSQARTISSDHNEWDIINLRRRLHVKTMVYSVYLIKEGNLWKRPGAGLVQRGDHARTWKVGKYFAEMVGVSNSTIFQIISVLD